MARFGDETIMHSRNFGTCPFPVQDGNTLRFDIDRELANMLCCKNREYAEEKNYFLSFLGNDTEMHATTFYDSVTGKTVFSLKRSWSEFMNESKEHGWSSFRDEDVNWENVRVLEETGETEHILATAFQTKREIDIASIWFVSRDPKGHHTSKARDPQYKEKVNFSK